MDRPLISYCVFTYNQEGLVGEAVESAFAQTYSPLEIILSDDGSSDRTFDIMSEMAAAYSGPHTIVINRNEQNLGITPHFNKVLMELASGEILVMAAGDDISYPHRVERIWREFAEGGEKMMLVGSLVDTISPDGKPIPTMDRIFNSSRVVLTLKDYAEGRGKKDYKMFGATLAFRSAVMDRFGPLSELSYGEDQELCIRGLLLGHNGLIDEKLIKYRSREIVYSSNPSDHFVIRNPKIYGYEMSSHTAVLLSVINFQWKTGDLTDKTVLKAKYVLLKEIKRCFVKEELSKSFPGAGLGLYFRLWRYQRNTAIKFTLYKLGLFGLFTKLYSRHLSGRR